MSVSYLEETRYVNVMFSLLILALIGAASGGIGGMLTNGLDGFMVGSCAGFILGVVAWLTDNMTEQQKQERHVDHFPVDLDQRASPVYDQATASQPPTEPLRSS